MNEKMYLVTNERYSRDPGTATMAEIMDLLRNAFDDKTTMLEERSGPYTVPGIYEVGSGELVAELVGDKHWIDRAYRNVYVLDCASYVFYASFDALGVPGDSTDAEIICAVEREEQI